MCFKVKINFVTMNTCMGYGGCLNKKSFAFRGQDKIECVKNIDIVLGLYLTSQEGLCDHQLEDL